MKKLKELIADEPEWPHAYKIVEIDGVEWLCGEFEVEGHLITFYGKNFDDLVENLLIHMKSMKDFVVWIRRGSSVGRATCL